MGATTILVAVLAVCYVLARRLAGQPLQAGRLVVLPLILAGWGALNLSSALAGASALDLATLTVEAAVAVLAGAARGLTIRLYPRDGHLWFRYRPATIAVWVALIVVRLGIGLGAAALGAHSALLGAALLCMLGLSLLGEGAVVRARAVGTGVPFAPRGARRVRASSAGVV